MIITGFDMRLLLKKLPHELGFKMVNRTSGQTYNKKDK